MNSEAKADIERILGFDIIRHERLVGIVSRAWDTLSPRQRHKDALGNWRQAIQYDCLPALASAERRLQERNAADPTALAVKVRVMRAGFANQVTRAMSDVAESHRERVARVA